HTRDPPPFPTRRSSDLKTLTHIGISLGTPQYMAPEQVLAKPLSPATDIYQLGVVMYEMLLGRLPFVARKPQAVALQHAHDMPPRSEEHTSELQSLRHLV